MVLPPEVWGEKEPGGGLVSVQLGSRGWGDDGQAQSGPGLTPGPRGTLTPLKAKPDPGLGPPFQSWLSCTPRIVTEGPGLGRAACPPRLLPLRFGRLCPQVWGGATALGDGRAGGRVGALVLWELAATLPLPRWLAGGCCRLPYSARARPRRKRKTPRQGGCPRPRPRGL